MPQAPCFLPLRLNCGAEAGSGSSTQAGRGPRCPHNISPGICLQMPRMSWQRLQLGCRQTPQPGPQQAFPPPCHGARQHFLLVALLLLKSSASWEEKTCAYTRGHLENRPLSRCRSERGCGAAAAGPRRCLHGPELTLTPSPGRAVPCAVSHIPGPRMLGGARDVPGASDGRASTTLASSVIPPGA